MKTHKSKDKPESNDSSSSDSESRSNKKMSKKTYKSEGHRRETERDSHRTYHTHKRNDRERDKHELERRGEQRSRHDRDRREKNRRLDENRSRDRRYQRERERSRSRSHEPKWGKGEDSKKDKKPVEKEKPNFGLSGKLTEERNTYKGVVIKYSEPPEARKPKRRWRLYPFKGERALQTLFIHRESAYLIGRERKVVDLPVDHPSCSKQHAALQYRLVPFLRDDGSSGKRVRPYLIDLDSANGTFINNKKIDSRKYIELLERDVIKFGFSTREYVLLHENSKDEMQDDDVKLEEEEKIKEEVKTEEA